MRSYFADIEKYLYSWFNAGDSTKVLPVIVKNMQSWLFRDQWTKTVTMSKDETDKYKTLVSNLENELKSKGEKWEVLTNVCWEVKLYPLFSRKQKFHAWGRDPVAAA